jgi:hypothetical protein
MEPVTILLMLAAAFVLFLMLTAGHRKHRLEKVLSQLETSRMKLLKSIEHVKLSYYQKKLGEKEAQDKIFELEEKLRGIEEKILEIKEKPLMRTVRKQEKQKESKDVREESEVQKGERVMMSHWDAKGVITLFVVAIIVIMAVIFIAGNRGGESHAVEEIEIPVSARTVPEGGTYPGSSAGLRVELENTYGETLQDVIVWARVPAGSGIRFEDGGITGEKIEVFEMGGVREIFFPMQTSLETQEGEYVIGVEVTDNGRLNVMTSTKLTVRIGAEE